MHAGCGIQRLCSDSANADREHRGLEGFTHVVEHSVKTWQSAVLGHDPALGIAGHYGPLIPIHLWLNLTVYLLVLPHLVAWTLRLRKGRTRTPAPRPTTSAPARAP